MARGIILSSNTGTTQNKVIIKNTSRGSNRINLLPRNDIVLISVNDGVDRIQYKSTDFGETFNVFDIPSFGRTNKSLSFNQRYYAIGTGDESGGTHYVRYSSDFGQTFTNSSISSTSTASFSNLSMSRDGKYVIASSGSYFVNGNVIFSDDFGQTWTQLNNGARYTQTLMDMSGQHIMYGGWGTLVYYSEDFGQTWDTLLGIDNFGGGSISDDGDYSLLIEFYRSGGNARAYVSNDWTNWDYTPLTPRIAHSAISNDGKYMVALGSDGYNSLDKISISSDYGQNWSLVSSVVEQEWREVGMSEDGKYILASPGGHSNDSFNSYYKSVDYGQTWILITELNTYNNSSNVKVSKNGKYSYISHPNGLYISSDYMSTWENKFEGDSVAGVFINF